MTSRGLVTVFALGLAACTSTHVSSLPLGEATYPPQPENHPIAVYETATDVQRPFVKVGRVDAHRTGSYNLPQASQIGEVIEPMKREARKLGADALVLRGGFEVSTTMEVRSTPSGDKGSVTSAKSNTASVNGADLWGHNAVAIRYVDGASAGK